MVSGEVFFIVVWCRCVLVIFIVSSGMGMFFSGVCGSGCIGCFVVIGVGFMWCSM